LYQAEKDYWRDFATDARRLGSPFYEQLSLAVDGDTALKALAAKVRPGQPPANVLFAAVHYLLLRGADHPLRNFYATLGGGWAGEPILPLFQDFVACHGDEVRHLVETRVTNTNEVARSCVLRPGFAALAKRESRRLHLVEIGPSAGLNLNWDRFGMRYRREGAIAAALLPDAPLQLDCELRGALTPPLTPVPAIASRMGLELHPVDLLRKDDRDWLRALVWPDQPQRLERLDRAIAIFRQHPQTIRGGDALALLPDALAAPPPHEALCVYHTIAVYQFSTEMKEALTAMLVMAGLRRPVWHLAFEFDGGESYALTLSRHEGGRVETQKLALAQPHGGWLEWLLP
jgi:hypothetical protein